MRDAWLARAAKRLRELFHGIREKGYPSDWISDDIFNQLKEYWASDEYLALKRMNKANRASSAGGSLHTGGSITYPTTAEKMLEELERTPTQSKVFTRTHTKKKDRGQWVDQRDEEANVSLVVAGGRKRGRVYGRGKVPSRLKPTIYDSDDLSTASGPVDMRDQVTLLNRELTQQAEEHKQEKGTEQITTVFKSCYKWYVPHFHLAPEEAINTWWDEWKKAFRFRKGESEKMRDAWLARAAKRLRELFHGIREKGYPSDWIPDDIFKQLKEYWASDEYLALKRMNKANRASSAGGSLHTGGSITYPATAEKMLEELERTPT
ncbi:hypothetical protein PIB30_104695 [Stylosanthes scabra]|uniref:Uncharacterized protein n=1 Tax=Stylosanthes scabra TaxID=79078 RepID=A0ABU6XYL0_9FABA|nr:hypothetical protein [Stylosanthes scabra]